MSIRWSTIIASPEDGAVDYARVRSLVSVLLAAAGGIMAVWVVFLIRNVDTALVSIAVTAMVLPLTGGKVADAIRALKDNKVSAAIQAGAAPGRRASDSGKPA